MKPALLTAQKEPKHPPQIPVCLKYISPVEWKPQRNQTTVGPKEHKLITTDLPWDSHYNPSGSIVRHQAREARHAGVGRQHTGEQVLLFKTGRALGLLKNIDIPQQLSQISIIQTKHLILTTCNHSASVEQTLLLHSRSAMPGRCGLEDKAF